MSNKSSLVQRIRCTFKSEVTLDQYYQSLSEELLKQKQQTLWQVFATPILAWIVSFALIFWATNPDLPILIALLVSFGGTIVALVSDFQRRKKVIDQELKKRRL